MIVFEIERICPSILPISVYLRRAYRWNRSAHPHTAS